MKRFLSPRNITIAFVVAGFVVIILGWWGAAQVDFVEGQIPYLLSGGVVGLGLVAAGLTLAIVHQQRRNKDELTQKLDEIAAALRDGGRGRDHSDVSDGGSALAALAAGTAVVAGPTVYHLPGCRVLDGREELPIIAPDEASARGLTPCRVCGPKPATV